MQKKTPPKTLKKPQTPAYKTPIDLSFGYQNIEGIHSPIFSCKLPYVHSKFIHDIEVLSETWGSCNHDKNIEGYKLIEEIVPQKMPNIRAGRSSGGLLVYCKNSLSKYIKKTKVTPYYIWITIDKSIFFNLNKSIKVCLAYNPPENSNYCNKEIYDDISLDLLQKSNSSSPILLMGDFNARTGEEPDYEDTEDKHMEYTTGRLTFPKERRNQDKTVNIMGQKLIDMCKTLDLQILNGRSIGDSTGSMSFYDAKKGASAIDLAIASDPIIKEVKTFCVNNPVEYSDHCKIELRLSNILQVPEKEEVDTYHWIELGSKYVWKDDSEGKYEEALNSPQVLHIAAECEQYLEAGLVEQASEKLVSMFIKAADISLDVKKPRKAQVTKEPYKHKRKWKKWV